ncbi:hypothetical protein HDU96_008272 [Phlyctochytrium bullatum]|nr:hypothetical protein HDU96_008272 [Phlyctochytrium bullatum]
MSASRSSRPALELPEEVLSTILSHTDFSSTFYNVVQVNRAWSRVAFDIKVVRVRATPTVQKLRIDAILSRFPVLEELILEPSTRSLEYGPNLIHEVARSFTGHPTLRRIRCGSDFIVAGALNGCPRLEDLNLSYMHTWMKPRDDGTNGDDGTAMSEDNNGEGNETQMEMDGAFSPNMPLAQDGLSGFRRNLASILKKGRALKKVDIEAATFWHRSARTAENVASSVNAGPLSLYKSVDSGFVLGSNLEVLRLTNFSGWSLQNFSDWLGAPSSPGLPALREFRLDADYLNLPASMIKNLGQACPSLRSLKIKYANLAPAHLLEMAATLPQLHVLSLGKCEMWFLPAANNPSLVGRLGSDRIAEIDSEDEEVPAIVATAGSLGLSGTSLSIAGTAIMPLPAPSNQDNIDSNEDPEGEETLAWDGPSPSPSMQSSNIAPSSLSSRSVSYADLVDHMTSAMPELHSLHLNSNVLHAMTPPLLPAIASLRNSSTSRHAQQGKGISRTGSLESLKIFDTADTRPDAEQVVELVGSYPSLRSLRMDVPAGQDIAAAIADGAGLAVGIDPGPPATSQNAFAFIQESLPELTRLELRCAKQERPNAPTGLSSSRTGGGSSSGLKRWGTVTNLSMDGLDAESVMPLDTTQDYEELAGRNGSEMDDDGGYRELSYDEEEAELRREYDMEEKRSSGPAGKLTDLTLWAAHPSTIPGLLQYNSATLTSLSLNYVPGWNLHPMVTSSSAASPGSIPPLPALRKLTIKTLSNMAVFDAMSLLDGLLGDEDNESSLGLPSLTHLHVDALHRAQLPPLTERELLGIARRTPSLRHLKLGNLKVSEKVWKALVTGKSRSGGSLWPELETIDLAGSFGGIGAVLDSTWVDKLLKPFIEQHRKLRGVALHVDGVVFALDSDIPIEPGQQAKDSEGQGGSWKRHLKSIVDRRVADLSGYLKFSKWVAEKWQNLEAVTIMGPLSGIAG